jgi:hypothetical protein
VQWKSWESAKHSAGTPVFHPNPLIDLYWFAELVVSAVSAEVIKRVEIVIRLEQDSDLPEIDQFSENGMSRSFGGLLTDVRRAYYVWTGDIADFSRHDRR